MNCFFTFGDHCVTSKGVFILNPPSRHPESHLQPQSIPEVLRDTTTKEATYDNLYEFVQPQLTRFIDTGAQYLVDLNPRFVQFNISQIMLDEFSHHFFLILVAFRSN
jgi:hypothetical protein